MESNTLHVILWMHQNVHINDISNINEIVFQMHLVRLNIIEMVVSRLVAELTFLIYILLSKSSMFTEVPVVFPLMFASLDCQ